MLNPRWLACAICFGYMLCGINCCANNLPDVNEASTQANEIQNSGAVISIQKQPVTDTTKQIINAKKCFFCIFIQVNGKIKEDIK